MTRRRQSSSAPETFTLRRVTDLFIDGAVDCSSEQVDLFDDVFQCLMHHIETSAKALIANRPVPINTAPPLIIRAAISIASR